MLRLVFLVLVPVLGSRFAVLDPSDFGGQLGDDLPWAEENAPFFECSDADITDTFYFRISNYKLHITPTPMGFVVTEFLPEVPWSGKYNTIPAAAGHHIMEGSWWVNQTWVDDYSRFWFLPGGGSPRSYTFWAATAIWRRVQVTGNLGLALDLLPQLQANVAGWRESHFNTQYGLFYQTDGADAEEDSISGSGLRPSINSVMYSEFRALSEMCAAAGNSSCAAQWDANATSLQAAALTHLWNNDTGFFSTFKADADTDAAAETACPPPWPANQVVSVRQLLGLSCPWMFGLVPPASYKAYAPAWSQLNDPMGFGATWGPTTAERRSPCYNYSVHHECLWNAPSWPYETSRVGYGLTQLLNNYPPQPFANRTTFFNLIKTYSFAHLYSMAINGTHPWIGEDLHPDLGYWIARSVLYSWNNTLRNRGKNYNHSVFLDLILTGLVGIRPSANQTLTVNPLLDPSSLSYFCADGVPYHGHMLTVFWDVTGGRYGKGSGLHVWVDGAPFLHSPSLQTLQGVLP